MVMPQIGPALFSNPPKERAEARNPRNAGPTAACFAISASLTAEDDFELGGEFFDVFVRAGERIAGFVAGCLAAGAIWMLYAAVCLIWTALQSG